MATGKSSAKSGGKNRSACFFVKDGFPEEEKKEIQTHMFLQLYNHQNTMHKTTNFP